MKRLLIFASVALGAVYIALCGFLYFTQDTLIFPNVRDARQETLASIGAEIRIETRDGETLYGRYEPAATGKPTVLFFHGNGSQVTWESPRAAEFISQGYGVLLIEYRGYPGSTGAPSEEGLLLDGLTAYDWLVKNEAGDIVLNAHSLGTGVALYVASQRPVKAVALEAPYLSLDSVARDHYPIFPVSFLMRHKFPAHQWIEELSAPLLIIHGERDSVIPIAQGKKLYQRALEPKGLEIIAHAGHSNLFQYGATQKVIAFFDDISAEVEDN